jgi:hypothetical protein
MGLIGDLKYVWLRAKLKGSLAWISAKRELPTWIHFESQPETEARLIELTYRELRRIAAGHMWRERSVRSLQVTDLLHEPICGSLANATRTTETARIFFK